MSTTNWLAGTTVLDAGTSPAARYCGWLFVQNGATVVDRGAADGLPAHAQDFLDTGKVVDAEARHFDVAIVDENSPDIAHDAAITGVLEKFGPGPRRDWAADELVLSAMGGAAAYTRGRGGEPVYGFGYRYQYLAGLYLYTALTAALLDDRSARGRRVSVSELETVVSLLPYPTTQYAYNGSTSLLEQSGPRFVVGCRDGWVVVYAGLAWTALIGMLGRPDLAHDPRFERLDERFRHVTELQELFEQWGSDMTVEQALALGAEHDVASSEVLSPAEVLADEEIVARGSWQPVRGGGSAPSLPYLVISEGLEHV